MADAQSQRLKCVAQRMQCPFCFAHFEGILGRVNDSTATADETEIPQEGKEAERFRFSKFEP